MPDFEGYLNRDGTNKVQINGVHKEEPTATTEPMVHLEEEEKKVIRGEQLADVQRSDRSSMDAVREKLNNLSHQETWHDPEKLHFVNGIGFTVETQDRYQSQGQEPISVEYQLNEDGTIREFTKIEFSSAYENFALMNAVKRMFLLHDIVIEEVPGEARFTVPSEVLSNPESLNALKQILQVGSDGRDEYINRKLNLV